MFVTFTVIAMALLAVVASIIAFNAPRTPPRMASVEDAFAQVDFSDMPAKSHFTARDGTRLDYRAYRGASKRVVILVHGSSGTTHSMHAVAHAIHARGPTVYALAMRGHDGTGRDGDIDYVGQLDDDLADFIKTLGTKAADEERTLLGFSSGGGFVLRIAGSANAEFFDKFMLISPQLPHDAPTSGRTPAAGSQSPCPALSAY